MSPRKKKAPDKSELPTAEHIIDAAEEASLLAEAERMAAAEFSVLESPLTPVVGLAAKLAAVMGDLKQIQKRGHNTHFNYKFATNEDVLDTLRPLLAAHGVAFSPSMEEVTVTGKLVMCRMNMVFTDGETGETRQAQWFGQAVDTGDKGIAKCATSAVKYYLLKAFLLSAGDEPDTDNDADTHNETVSVEAPKQKAKPTVEAKGIKKLQELVGKSGRTWGDFVNHLYDKEGIRITKITPAQVNYWIKRLEAKLSEASSGVDNLKKEILNNALPGDPDQAE